MEQLPKGALTGDISTVAPLLMCCLAEVGRPYLCRKCFYGYEKVLKGTEAIKENMNKALEEVLPLADNTDSSESLPPPAKKRCQPLPPQSLITSGSPSVSVSIISLPMP